MGRAGKLKLLLNFYPPLRFSGIRVKAISDDCKKVEVELREKFWNRNVVGTHFGGSLYVMCDPFFMLILMENLGREYIVWDKAATIRFIKPGKGIVSAVFNISGEEIETIRRQAEHAPKVEPLFRTRVTNEMGETVAEVEKLLYVRKKAGAMKEETRRGVTSGNR